MTTAPDALHLPDAVGDNRCCGMPFLGPGRAELEIVGAGLQGVIAVQRRRSNPGRIRREDYPLVVDQGNLFGQAIDDLLEDFDEWRLPVCERGPLAVFEAGHW